MSEIVYSDSVGFAVRNSGPLLRSCEAIPAQLRSALLQRMGTECRLTPIQAEAIEAGICNRSNHFIVLAPTNSGKTLVALFRVFSDLIKKRGRCIYVAPLKALAEEKRIELEDLSQMIASDGGPKIRLSITTGDYQLTGEFLGSPPPEDGELIICTPERLEILLRSRENIYWARTASTIVLDEFHLLGDPHRGATVEILVTRILSSCPWSRIVALSATMGGLESVGKWLGVTGTKVNILENSWRYPTLNRIVVSTDDKEAYTREIAATVLEDPERSLLIFVSQKRDAEQIAKRLKKELNTHKTAISYLHAGLTLKERSDRLNDLLTRQKRVIVATTALKMGIDAPVTDVLVRDVFLWGDKRRKLLSYADLLQMTGRAGRRDKPGNAVVLCSDNQAETVAELFRVADVESLSPQLIKTEVDRNNMRQPDPILSILLSEIVMQGKTTISHLNGYLSHSFSGSVTGSADCLRQVNELIRLKLVYRSEEEPEFVNPTKLGKTVSLTGLSPESGAIIAGFLRALIKLDEKYEERKGRRFEYWQRLTDLDLIFICCACYECRSAWLKTPTKKTIADVQEFLETLPPDEKPIANLWCDEISLDYPTRRLLTSLKIPFEKEKAGQAEKIFYRLMWTAVLLYQHAKGVPLASLAVKFKAGLGGLENNLKFTVLWVLSCFSQICNPIRCYKFKPLMMQSLKLIECIAVGSELGKLLTIKGIGRQTVQKLLDGGIKSIDDLSDRSISDILQLGVREKQAKLIKKRMERQSR